MFEPECGLSMKVEHETKGKYSVPVTIIITDASAKVKGPSKPNAAYQRLDIAETYIRNAKKCWWELCNLKRILTKVMLLAMDLNHPIRIGTAVNLFLWCDTDEGSNGTIKIRTQEKNDYWL